MSFILSMSFYEYAQRNGSNSRLLSEYPVEEVGLILELGFCVPILIAKLDLV